MRDPCRSLPPNGRGRCNVIWPRSSGAVRSALTSIPSVPRRLTSSRAVGAWSIWAWWPMATVAPALASARVVAAPIPVAGPVTRATRPCRGRDVRDGIAGGFVLPLTPGCHATGRRPHPPTPGAARRRPARSPARAGPSCAALLAVPGLARRAGRLRDFHGDHRVPLPVPASGASPPSATNGDWTPTVHPTLYEVTGLHAALTVATDTLHLTNRLAAS